MRIPSARLALFAVTRRSPTRPPHVSPMFVFDDGRRYWMTTSRSAFKTRAVDARPRAALLVGDDCVDVTVDRFDWTRPTDWLRGALTWPSTAFGMLGYGTASTPYAVWYLRDARDVPEQWQVWSRTLLRATPTPRVGIDAAPDTPAESPGRTGPDTGDTGDTDVVRRLTDRLPAFADWPAALAWRTRRGAPALARVTVTADPTTGTVHFRPVHTGDVPTVGTPVSVVFDGSTGHRAADMAGATVEGTVRRITSTDCTVAVSRGWYWTGWDHRSV